MLTKQKRELQQVRNERDLLRTLISNGPPASYRRDTSEVILENQKLKKDVERTHEWGCGCLDKWMHAKEQLANTLEQLEEEKAAHLKTREQLAAVASTACATI